jgi:hypothetical protein
MRYESFRFVDRILRTSNTSTGRAGVSSRARSGTRASHTSPSRAPDEDCRGPALKSLGNDMLGAVPFARRLLLDLQISSGARDT